jgi:HAD superfamily hydrolase (TIGR01509 family)
MEALLFDFDGLLVDTESAALSAWEGIFRGYRTRFPVDAWCAAVGAADGFDAFEALCGMASGTLQRNDVEERYLRELFRAADRQPLRRGVARLVLDARMSGLRTAIVSGASRAWIDRHLGRLCFAEGWDAIVTGERDKARAKPSPLLYNEALSTLGLAPRQAIAFEDSPHGVRAAKAAGLACIAIPNRVTRALDLSEADLVLDSLATITLAQLLARMR